MARIPDRQMIVVARGLRWREPLKPRAAMRLGAVAGSTVAGLAGLILQYDTLVEDEYAGRAREVLADARASF